MFVYKIMNSQIDTNRALSEFLISGILIMTSDGILLYFPSPVMEDTHFMYLYFRYSYGEHVQGLVELKLGIVTLENVVLFPQSYMGVVS